MTVMQELVAGVLLAAGQSKRFGRQKLNEILPDQKTSVAVQSAQNMIETLPNSVAVVNPYNQQLKQLLGENGIQFTENPDASLGISSSIHCGIRFFSNQRPLGWIIALADMPFISPSIYKSIERALIEGATIVAPVFEGQRGHPVGFSNKLGGELLGLKGDVGARPLLNKYKHDLQLIEVSSHSVIRDIDQPEDLSVVD